MEALEPIVYITFVGACEGKRAGKEQKRASTRDRANMFLCTFSAHISDDDIVSLSASLVSCHSVDVDQRLKLVQVCVYRLPHLDFLCVLHLALL